ncbi:Thioredoxin reductase 3 [Orchesella cincta]|uniref:thioredoxin-disulfide reductase (NADPH) n=1 Tax=Orchesella cincta TaxID=48709 RepID=A0A1D2MHZ5_ORCCI|nr:Thioredoxin reductase 3 [Orchesella cincta]
MYSLLRRTLSSGLSSYSRTTTLPYNSRKFSLARLHQFGRSYPLSQWILWSKVITPVGSRDLELRRQFLSSMPPSGGGGSGAGALKAKIDGLISENSVIVFSKTFCPFCTKVKNLLTDLGVQFKVIELDTMEADEGAKWQEALLAKSGQRTVPNVYIRGQHIGGSSDVFQAFDENRLLPLIKGESGAGAGDSSKHSFEYDLIVIGGGSGGLAASKAAAKLGKKKLMHQAALIGQTIGDARVLAGMLINCVRSSPHEWATLVENVQNYIRSLNWGYRLALKDGSVTYLNEYARFVDKNTVETVNKKGQKKIISSNKFIIAVGGRPKYPDIPGASEYAITSDDLFSLPYHPGKVLCVGASYIALECAGFLAGLGIDTSVMVRSILLRGFDQQIAGMIGDHMESHGIKFLRGWVPTEIVKVSDGSPPKLLVKAKESNGTNDGDFDYKQRSNHGTKHLRDWDVALDRPELTPVAIQAGNLLVERLYKGSTTLTDYTKIPTTVFTPLEYGCIGLSEEDATKWYGANVEVYHNFFQPLEATLPKRDENRAYCKLVCNKADNDRVVGFHYLGPNAGEVTQGFAVALRLGATKADFDSTIGIHPTTAETFTTMSITKSSELAPPSRVAEVKERVDCQSPFL